MRKFFIACLIFGFAGPCLASPADDDEFIKIKSFFESREDLKSHREFADLLRLAQDRSSPRRMQESRDQLTDHAYPIAMALGVIDSRGLAPLFFKPQLEKNPIDYRMIIRRFEEYKNFAAPALSAEASPWATESAARHERVEDHVAAEIKARGYEVSMLDPASGDLIAVDNTAPPPEMDYQDGLIYDTQYALNYKQKRYQPVDLQGDVALIEKTKTIPKNIIKSVIGLQTITPDPRPPFVSKDGRDLNPIVAAGPEPEAGPNSYLTIEGRNNPLRVREMEKMFTQILAQEWGQGMAPKYGKPHHWSPDFVQKYNLDYISYAQFSKLLMALSSGSTSKFMASGKEIPLIAYILSRQDGSVKIHELLRKSYQLNDGDVYLTLLTIENILSAYWKSPSRGDRALARKLSPITNHYQGRGDKWGAWYHLFGIMLYGYTYDELSAKFVAKTETVGSHILSRGTVETQEDWINSQGGSLGARLRRIVEEKKYRDFKPGPVNYEDPNIYLDLNEDFSDRVPSADLKPGKS